MSPGTWYLQHVTQYAIGTEAPTLRKVAILECVTMHTLLSGATACRSAVSTQDANVQDYVRGAPTSLRAQHDKLHTLAFSQRTS